MLINKSRATFEDEQMRKIFWVNKHSEKDNPYKYF